jgi:hypothetical protein
MNKTLKELKNGKETLENQIKQLIKSFEEEFEVEVENINVYKTTWENALGKKYSITSGLNVEINVFLKESGE